MIDVDPEIIAYVITIALAVLSMVLGKKYKTAKSKFSEISGIAKELAEALKATSEAIEDEHISSDEAKEIVKQWKDVIEQGEKLLDSS